MTMKSVPVPVLIGLLGIGLIAWGVPPAFATDMRPEQVLLAWTYILIGTAMAIYGVANVMASLKSKTN